jgi:hypothetical protein
MLVSLLVAASVSLSAQHATTTALPIPFPDLQEQALRALLVRAEKKLAKGEFKEAAAIVDKLSLEHIRWSLDISQVPLNEQQSMTEAVQAGVAAWVTELGGEPRIEQVEHNPNLEITLLPGYSLGEPQRTISDQNDNPGCQEFDRTPGEKKNRHVSVKIYLDQGPEGTPHTPRQIAHLTGRAVGYYFGLRVHSTPIGMMGTDLHYGVCALQPTSAEIAGVKGVVGAAKQIRDHAANSKTIELKLPELVFESDRVDLGVANAFESITTEIPFSNSGNAPLHIMTIGSDCRCAVSEWDREVMPGEKGKISVKVDTSTLRGAVSRRLTINSDDQEDPLRIVVLDAVVLRDLATYPPGGMSVDLPIDEDFVLEFFVYSPTGKSFKIRNVVCTPTRHKAEFEQATLKFKPTEFPNLEEAERPGWQVRITIPETEGHGGPLYGRYQIETDVEAPQPVISYQVRYTKGILVKPGVIQMSVRGSEYDRRVVQLEQQGAEFRILKIETSTDEVLTTLETIEQGHKYRVWFRPNLPLDTGTRSVRALVYTDSPKQSKIPITVWLNVVPEGAGPPGLGGDLEPGES